jgi:hypothetical protein
MAVVIKTKLATTAPIADAVPAQLAPGELAVNPESKRLWVGTSGNQVAELITSGRPDAGTIQGQTLMWNATANNWEVNGSVRTTANGQIALRNNAANADIDYRIGSAGSGSSSFSIQNDVTNTTGTISLYSGVLANGTSLQRQLTLSPSTVEIFPNLGIANAEAPKTAYIHGNLRVGKADATVGAEGGEIRLLSADGKITGVIDVRGTSTAGELRMYTGEPTAGNLRIINSAPTSTGGISLETGTATTQGVLITSNLVNFNGRTVHSAGTTTQLNFDIALQKKAAITFSTPDQNNPIRGGGNRGEIYYQDQTPTVNHRIQYNAVNKHMFGVRPLNPDNSFANKVDVMQISNNLVKIFGNLKIGPELAGSQEGGQIEFVGPDLALAYVTDIITSTADNSLTSNYRLRPVGDHTAGGIVIGGQGGGNSQPAIYLYTDGALRFYIDAAGITRGLWNNNGVSNPFSQFVVVTTAQLPATRDANIIYFVV